MLSLVLQLPSSHNRWWLLPREIMKWMSSILCNSVDAFWVCSRRRLRTFCKDWNRRSKPPLFHLLSLRDTEHKTLSCLGSCLFSVYGTGLMGTTWVLIFDDCGTGLMGTQNLLWSRQTWVNTPTLALINSWILENCSLIFHFIKGYCRMEVNA